MTIRASTILGLLVLASCVLAPRPGIITARSSARYPARPAGCQVGRRTDLAYPPDPKAFELVGVVAVRGMEATPEVEARIRDYACEWGGDALIPVQLSAGIMSFAVFKNTATLPDRGAATAPQVAGKAVLDAPPGEAARAPQAAGKTVLDAAPGHAATVAQVAGKTVLDAPPGERDSVALLPLVPKGLPKLKASILDDLLAVAVSNLGRLDVLTVADVDVMLAREKTRDVLGCDDSVCAAEIGSALGTRYLLFGTASLLGGDLVVTLSLLDTREQRVVARAASEPAHRESDYREALQGVLHRLLEAHREP